MIIKSFNINPTYTFSQNIIIYNKICRATVYCEYIGYQFNFNCFAISVIVPVYGQVNFRISKKSNNKIYSLQGLQRPSSTLKENFDVFIAHNINKHELAKAFRTLEGL